jgi:CNT family concentrative nucleoside transporter
MQTLMSIVGIFVLLAIAFLLSTDRSAINRRTVMTAFALQAGIAGLIMFVPQGSDVLDVV